MSNVITFDIEKRDETLNPRQLRAEGKLPATVYGKGQESVSIQLDRRDFVNSYKKNKDAVYELKGDGNTFQAKVQNLQYNYRTQEELNIEFLLVK